MPPRELKLVYGFGDFVAIMEPFVEYGAEFVRLYKEFICLLPKSLNLNVAGVAGFDLTDHEERGRNSLHVSIAVTEF